MIIDERISELTPRDILEIQGSFHYFLTTFVITVIATAFQIIANVSASEVILPLVVNITIVLLAFIIYWRKRTRKKTYGLILIVAFLSLTVPVFAKYKYGFGVDWTFASQSYNTSIVLITYIVALQWQYRKKTYLVFALYGILQWCIFLVVAHNNGALFYLHAISDGKPITDGVVILREIFFVMMAVVLALVAYRNIPIIEEYDDRTTRQRKRIEQQTEAQMEVTRDIRAMTENLGHQVDEQSVVVDSLNESMQSQAATFEEVSATLEELLGSAENIQHSASDQVEGNVTMEGIIHEFNEIKLETRDNLNATYDLIEEVVSETSVANESLTEVEGTINRIKQQSDTIGNTINIIVEIADQINLLSLNASIEAARAGDYGRGFAVVADEIGKLASQTTDSIKEIERVLHDSARISEEGVDVINRTASTIKELINRMLESSGKVKMLQDSFMVEEKYTRIVVEQMDKNLELAKNISTATDEQKDAIKSSSDAIEHVNEIVGEMVEQTKHLSSSARSVLDFSMDLVKKSDKAVRLDSNNEEE